MLTVNDLSYTYPGNDAETLHGLSFAIPKGEIFGFLGPSGAGKSTTQNLLIGLLKGYRGHVNFAGRELSDWKNDLYTRVGVVFEVPNLFGKLTALENLRFFGALYGRISNDPLELLELVGLKEDADKKVSSFSKGMRMRLNYCRAFLHDPEFLFLDEPTAGLDPANARIIRDHILRQKATGKTIFLTTHNMHDADQLCDRVAFIVDGRLETIASPRELKLSHGTRRVRVEHRVNGGTASREFELDKLADNGGFLDILRAGKVETIHTLEATLEDIFMDVTGRRLT